MTGGYFLQKNWVKWKDNLQLFIPEFPSATLDRMAICNLCSGSDCYILLRIAIEAMTQSKSWIFPWKLGSFHCRRHSALSGPATSTCCTAGEANHGDFRGSPSHLLTTRGDINKKLVGGDWNMTFIFSIHWECHHPNLIDSYFSELLKPPTRQAGSSSTWKLTKKRAFGFSARFVFRDLFRLLRDFRFGLKSTWRCQAPPQPIYPTTQPQAPWLRTLRTWVL